MGFFKEVGKVIKFGFDPGGLVTDALHGISGVPTADEKRNAQKLMNDQIKAYKDQTDLARQELNEKRDQVAAEKRRVNEKQIRSLRRNYSSPGFLGGSDSSQPDMTSKLGG